VCVCFFAFDPYLLLYEVFNNHPNVIRVFALSGGYERGEATARLKGCKGMSASFSRALTEGLKVDQVPDEFDATLDSAVRDIFEASRM
jgi:fructose-bisphosphate aldolase class I